jgi:hypothetical protein
MHSLREHFRAIGLGDAGGSVLHGFFGLGEVPANETLSLKEQMARCRRVNVLHLNVIRLAYDTVIPRAPLERRIDLAVHRARQIYDQAGIGICRVLHYMVEDAFAGAYPDIGGDGEADDLCDAYSVYNDGIDTFVVLSYAGGTIGSSRSGSCDKDAKGGTSGIVVELGETTGRDELYATAYSHELCHYLGVAQHNTDTNNLMCTCDNKRQLSGSQISMILDHCMITRTFLVEI